MARYLYNVSGETRSASVGEPEPRGEGDFAVVLTLDPSDPKERRMYGQSREDALENALTVLAGLADRSEVWPKP
jgi:hypothetical protein